MSAVRAKERKTENGESCGKITSPKIKYTECTKSDPNRVIQWSLKNMKQRKIKNIHQSYTTMTIIHKSKESRIFKKLGATFGNYRHSLIHAVNVGTHKKTTESKNRVNRGYLVVLMGRKIG